MEQIQQEIKSIEKKIVEMVLQALDTKSIQEDEVSYIGEFVLDRIRFIKDKEELQAFLEDLSAEWGIFEPLLTSFLKAENDVRDDLVSENAQNLLKQGNIDEAINVLKSATRDPQDNSS